MTQFFVIRTDDHQYLSDNDLGALMSGAQEDAYLYSPIEDAIFKAVNCAKDGWVLEALPEFSMHSYSS